jgi:hypothetical protein
MKNERKINIIIYAASIVLFCLGFLASYGAFIVSIDPPDSEPVEYFLGFRQDLITICFTTALCGTLPLLLRFYTRAKRIIEKLE